MLSFKRRSVDTVETPPMGAVRPFANEAGKLCLMDAERNVIVLAVAADESDDGEREQQTVILGGALIGTEIAGISTINGVSAAAVATAAQNFDANNDRNGTTPSAPNVPSDGSAVDHVINTDGSADISFEWTYTPSADPGDAANIDGYIVRVYAASSNASYTFGAAPTEEAIFYLPAAQKALIVRGVPANKYYTFGVQAYRQVDSDITSGGMLASTIVKPGGADEDPYRPSSSVAFSGDVTGTIQGASSAGLVTGANAASAGLNPDGTVKTDKVDTPAIVSNAVTNLNYAYTPGTATFSASTWTAVQTVSFTATGAPVSIKGGCMIVIDSASAQSCLLRLCRGGTDLTGSFLLPGSISYEPVSGTTTYHLLFAGTFCIGDVPPSGSVTFTLEINSSMSSASGANCSNRYLEALEAKR